MKMTKHIGQLLVLGFITSIASSAQASTKCEEVMNQLKNGLYDIEISANGRHVDKGVVRVEAKDSNFDTYSFGFDIKFSTRDNFMSFALGLRKSYSASGGCEGYLYDHISSYRHEVIKMTDQELIFKAKKTGGFIKIKL